MRTVKLNKPAKILAGLVAVGMVWVVVSIGFLSSDAPHGDANAPAHVNTAAERESVKVILKDLRAKRDVFGAKSRAAKAAQDALAEESAVLTANERILREAAGGVGASRESLAATQVEELRPVECQPHTRHQCVERSRAPIPVSAHNPWQLAHYTGKGPM